MVETFEAREKKIGSIRIVKNPNFPSGTSLQAYIKTNRAELRKVFGNPNMGESGDGKSKGKEWNLIVGPHRVTIYDKREKDKKGTKYFNIGGSGKYGALLVAQALSIHRNERVHAKETVPQWLEDKRQYQQVKSIDEHPDLTYERAKEYEDNRRRYRAENLEAEDDLTFKEWADQEMKTHGGRESFDDWLDDELESHGDNVSLQDWGHHELDSHYERYGAEMDKVRHQHYQDMIAHLESRNDLSEMDKVKLQHYKDMLKMGAEFESLGYSYDGPPDDEDPMPEYYEIYLEDEEWKDIGLTEPESFEDYSKRINKEEDEMNDLRRKWMKDYDYQQPKNAEYRKTDDERILAIHKRSGKRVGTVSIETLDGGYAGNDDVYIAIDGYNEEDEHGSHPMIWDGVIPDSIYMAETSGQWEIGEQLEEAQMNAEEVCQDSHLDGIDFLEWSEEAEGPDCYITGLPNPEGDIEGEDNICEPCRSKWIYALGPEGEGYYRASVYYDAEDKKRKKLSGVLSDPFDELSLDSGDWKGIVVGFGIGLLGLFGYSKLRK